VATKIKLMRLGKMRAPYYRVVVADSRTKRDGRSIETIGKYHPKEDPSLIDIDTERALYWLRVGAQPTEAVAALLKVTGAWQEFKGLPAPPPMLVKAPKSDKKVAFQEAAREAASGKEAAEGADAKARPAKKVADKAAKDKPAKTADQASVEAAAEGQPLTEARESGSAAADGLAPSATADAAPEAAAEAPAEAAAEAPAEASVNAAAESAAEKSE
jgi:small subunit ribosomal protein S16